MRTTALLTEDEYEELTDILCEAESLDSRLTPWEVNFITDMQARVEKWENKTLVSPRQWEILHRIQDKLQ